MPTIRHKHQGSETLHQPNFDSFPIAEDAGVLCSLASGDAIDSSWKSQNSRHDGLYG
jgi:hypothetical protein